jgi:hypothetical protein
MRRKSLPLFACLAMTGCASGPSIQSQMAAFIGADTQTVVQKLGVPDKQIKVNDNTQYLAYNIITSYGYGGYYGPYAGGYYGRYYGSYFGTGGYYGGYPYVYSCEVTLMLTNDRVNSYTTRGYCN